MNGMMEEGDKCPLCEEGTLEVKPVENCSCHINPPCSACVETPLVCTVCGEEFEP